MPSTIMKKTAILVLVAPINLVAADIEAGLTMAGKKSDDLIGNVKNLPDSKKIELNISEFSNKLINFDLLKKNKTFISSNTG